MEKRRVVITGLGAVTPLGNNREAFWDGLMAGRSGVGPTTAFDARKLTTRIAAEVKDFDAGALLGKREARRMDRYAQMALVAAGEAISDAKFPEDPEVRARTGAIVATGIGGIITVENTTFEVGPGEKWDRISPFFVPMLMANAASAHISMNFGLRGPVFAVASACASANDALSTAYDKIILGEAVAVVSGGSEATVIPT
ncbi:MAG: beta-ketoacyl-[acyl-carrier-protein] synthase II, partial [Candidatus Eremiobacteraeota bacterium]|nr:beta-ketoacyl-[acyl-carrier-protein] synthase II [Candidatus Eremiobacteraeota bacterium]